MNFINLILAGGSLQLLSGCRPASWLAAGISEASFLAVRNVAGAFAARGLFPFALLAWRPSVWDFRRARATRRAVNFRGFGNKNT